MEVTRIYTDPTRHAGKVAGDWAEYEISNFRGGVHVSFLGTIEAMDAQGEFIGSAIGDLENEIQISVNPRGARRAFYVVRQGHVEQEQLADGVYDLIVRYQVQDDGYIEIRTFNPCSREIRT